MAAVMGMREDILKVIEAARDRDVLEAVNYNAELQTVISGDGGAIARFEAAARQMADAGEVKTLMVKRLAVSTAFHCSVMDDASMGLKEFAAEFEFGKPSFPVYLNSTADLLPAGADIAEIMAIQVNHPVLWEQAIKRISSESGADLIVEFGPGKTLTGLSKRNAPKLQRTRVEDAETLADAIRSIVT
jgi:[acyl-carrier-protein] S-malonyltransferase